MRTIALLSAVLILCSLPQVVLAQAPVLIDFDDLSAPCDLASAQPLRDEYAAFGVEFSGYSDADGAAVLGECSGYGIPGYSPPNFAVIDPEGLLATGGVPDELRFGFTGDVPRLVRVTVGGPPGTTVSLHCSICPWWQGCDVYDHIVLGDRMETLEVWANEPFNMGCEVRSESGVPGTWIVDDLEFHYQIPAIPSLSPAGFATLVIMIAALGFVLIRRVTRH
jgi:hypothetical protein